MWFYEGLKWRNLCQTIGLAMFFLKIARFWKYWKHLASHRCRVGGATDQYSHTSARYRYSNVVQDHWMMEHVRTYCPFSCFSHCIHSTVRSRQLDKRSKFRQTMGSSPSVKKMVARGLAAMKGTCVLHRSISAWTSTRYGFSLLTRSQHLESSETFGPPKNITELKKTTHDVPRVQGYSVKTSHGFDPRLRKGRGFCMVWWPKMPLVDGCWCMTQLIQGGRLIYHDILQKKREQKQ